MKNWIVVLSLATVSLAGCLKSGSEASSNCGPLTLAAPATEVAALKMYLDTNHIVTTQDSRGFFYTIDSSGSTSATGRPTLCSTINITYTGTFLNGHVFDQSGPTTPVSFNLSALIYGWQEAIPLMKANSTMKLYVPPSLGYGASGSSDSPQTIPPNTNLVFTIQLVAFN